MARLQRIADKVKNLFDDRLRSLSRPASSCAPSGRTTSRMWKRRRRRLFLSKRTLKEKSPSGAQGLRRHHGRHRRRAGTDLEPPASPGEAQAPPRDGPLHFWRTGRSGVGEDRRCEVPAHRPQMPEGFARINDKYGTSTGPPVQTVSEHVDKRSYDGLTKVAEGLGISPERKVQRRGRSKLGTAASPSGRRWNAVRARRNFSVLATRSATSSN